MSRILKNQREDTSPLIDYHGHCIRVKLSERELAPRLMSITDVSDLRLGDFVFFKTTWGDYFHDAKIINQMFSDWCILNNVKESNHQKKKFFVEFFESSEFYTPTIVLPA